MPIEVKRILLQKLRLRYMKASRRQKTLILDEFCATTELSRKHAIRLLNGEVKSHRNHPGPKLIYGDEIKAHIVELWRAMGQICSKKMVAAIPEWIHYYEGCAEASKALLKQISSSTIDRILRAHRDSGRRGLSTTMPTLIKNKIPLRLLDQDISEPGYMEGDTVAHCGTSMAGEFANTLTMTDLHSAWTELKAVYGKRSERVLEAIKAIEGRLPFPIRALPLITEMSSSITTCGPTSTIDKRKSILSGADPTRKTTMPMLNKKIGPTYASFLAMTALKKSGMLNLSTTSTTTTGRRFGTTSLPL